MIDLRMIDLEYRSLQYGIYRPDLTELLSSEYLIYIYIYIYIYIWVLINNG